MDFQQRLERAIERGHRRSDEQAQQRAAAALSEEELKRLYSQYRLSLAEHVEACLRQIPPHFPGFRCESVVGDRGWGAAVTRDDLELDRGRRTSLFSRLEVTVRPYSALHVLELSAKGTIRNKELFSRSYFQPLAEVDADSFHELVDRWVLEFAELFAAHQHGSSP